MEYLIRQIIISALFILGGALLYILINHIIDSIGKEGIDRVYETRADKLARERTKKRFGRIYTMLLFMLVVVINLVFYFFR